MFTGDAKHALISGPLVHNFPILMLTAFAYAVLALKWLPSFSLRQACIIGKSPVTGADYGQHLINARRCWPWFRTTADDEIRPQVPMELSHPRLTLVNGRP